ncbi:MAG: TRAM domain-containing protein [Candidatus Levyibacteriota bacterium]
MAKNTSKNKKTVKEEKGFAFSPNVIAMIADEVAKRLPSIPRSKKKKNAKAKKINNPIFLDTSAIIDGRIFEVISLKVFNGTFVILESILLELKHIADSQDLVKKERGRRGLSLLEKLKKTRGIKVTVFSDSQEKSLDLDKIKEVDEKLIKASKTCKARIITCDYNLGKKANISGITAINVNTLANLLKVTAIPGESFTIKLLHKGKDVTQGVGYLDDGTMIVVENASESIGKNVDIVVSRVIQTTAGRILFAKKIF